MSALAKAKRVQALKNFLAISQQRLPTKDTDAEFRTFLTQTLGLLEMSDIDFAELVPVSKQTVMRWKSGRSLPHRMLWGTIYDLLRRVVADEIEKLEAKL